jgi:hypothetical protein
MVAGLAAVSLLWSPVGAVAVTLEPVGDFKQPIFVTSAPDDPEPLFVVEREGLVVQVDDTKREVFADLTPLVSCCSGERGLLSIAIAPDFAATGRFYAAYTGDEAAGGAVGDVHVDAFHHGEAGELVREPIIAVDHSANANHNGGQLQFGPDGHLYVSIGDGGGGGDPFDAGQDLDTLLGTILRIEPRPGDTPSYEIPPGNPFAGPSEAALDEIWAYGLRNPWRFSFDRETGDLTIADVGQGAREEIDFAPRPAPGEVGGAGANYGWDCREGLIAYAGPPGSPSPACEGAGGFTDPIFDYPHTPDPDVGGGTRCSITGGYVVRDPGLGDLFGRYVYGDLCVGQIRSIDLAVPDPAATDRAEPGLGVPAFSLHSFGEDSCGRVYVATGEGPVYRLEGDEPADCSGGEDPDPEPEPDPEPDPNPEPEPAPPPLTPAHLVPSPPPSPRQPGIDLAHSGTRLQARVARWRMRSARGVRVRILVHVTPCTGSSERRVRLSRGGRRFAAKRLNRRCRASFHPRITHSSTFRALFHPRNGAHPIRSRRLVVQLSRRRHTLRERSSRVSSPRGHSRRPKPSGRGS